MSQPVNLTKSPVPDPHAQLRKHMAQMRSGARAVLEGAAFREAGLGLQRFAEGFRHRP
ncbi:hypothetical protein [Streptomyces niveus]|uniref:hypothetical protein n=1 Tax=Streptomyces niveus TaxID=193462 RepID=UPI001495D574|nr:hypothetical protein [Streptomyces niveus]